MTAPIDRFFFRVVHENPPSIEDLMSPEALGEPFVHVDPSRRRRWDGLSCYATEAQARRNARRYRSHGAYIAVIRIEDGAPIRAERTLGAGHYTLWGDPVEILLRVIAIIPAW